MDTVRLVRKRTQSEVSPRLAAFEMMRLRKFRLRRLSERICLSFAPNDNFFHPVTLLLAIPCWGMPAVECHLRHTCHTERHSNRPPALLEKAAIGDAGENEDKQQNK